METIKCPNCGSEKVQGVTEEKYVCLACDNVFLVHNLSKEFRQTDEHISSMHQDLKEDISKLMNGNVVDEAALLVKAEEHLKMEDWDTASGIFEKITEEYPQHSAAWYGLYKALTGNFEAVNRYALFVCDGNYLDEQDEEIGNHETYFLGSGYIKRALSCEDANKPEITKNVTAFIKRCAEHGKTDIEDSIRGLIETFQNTLNERDGVKADVARAKRNDQIKALIPAFLVIALLGISIMYFLAAGDWLGKVLGVVAFILVLKFGGRKIINSIRRAKAEGAEWTDVLSESIMPMVEGMDKQVEALMYYCIDLDNYNYILKSLQDEEQFIQTFANNPLNGLASYSECSDNMERFIFELLDGKIERYRYLLSKDMTAAKSY